MGGADVARPRPKHGVVGARQWHSW